MYVFVFHFGRSGSTVLMDCLSQQKTMDIHGEIFSGGTRMYDGFEESLWKEKKGNGVFLSTDEMCGYIENARDGAFGLDSSKPYVCEIKAYHFTAKFFRFSLDDCLKALRARFKDAMFVFLGRTNHVRRILSMQRAKTDGIWHMTDQAATNASERSASLKRTIELSKFRDSSLTMTGDLKLVLENSVRQVKVFSESISKYDGQCLWYEHHIFADPNCGAQMLSNWIGQPYAPVATKFRKTNEAPLRETVENYAELSNALKNTTFERLLD